VKTGGWKNMRAMHSGQGYTGLALFRSHGCTQVCPEAGRNTEVPFWPVLKPTSVRRRGVLACPYISFNIDSDEPVGHCTIYSSGRSCRLTFFLLLSQWCSLRSTNYNDLETLHRISTACYTANVFPFTPSATEIY